MGVGDRMAELFDVRESCPVINSMILGRNTCLYLVEQTETMDQYLMASVIHDSLPLLQTVQSSVAAVGNA